MEKTNGVHSEKKGAIRHAERAIRVLAGPGTSPGVALLVWFFAGLLGYLFTPDAREHFNLERLWSDGARVDVSAWVTAR